MHKAWWLQGPSEILITLFVTGCFEAASSAHSAQFLLCYVGGTQAGFGRWHKLWLRRILHHTQDWVTSLEKVIHNMRLAQANHGRVIGLPNLLRSHEYLGALAAHHLQGALETGNLSQDWSGFRVRKIQVGDWKRLWSLAQVWRLGWGGQLQRQRRRVQNIISLCLLLRFDGPLHRLRRLIRFYGIVKDKRL